MLPGEPKRNQWLHRCRVVLEIEPKLVQPHFSLIVLLVNLTICCVVDVYLPREVANVDLAVQVAHRHSRVSRHLLFNVLHAIVAEDEGCMRCLNVEHQQQQQYQLVVCRDMLVAVGDIAHEAQC